MVAKSSGAKIRSLNGGSCVNTTRLRIGIGEFFADQLIRNSKFLTKFTERLSSG